MQVLSQLEKLQKGFLFFSLSPSLFSYFVHLSQEFGKVNAGNLYKGNQEIIYCEADAYQLDDGTNPTISSEEVTCGIHFVFFFFGRKSVKRVCSLA